MATALVQKDKIQTVRELLGKNASQIKLALPKHINPERMQRCVITACLQTPKILECTQQSIMISVLRAAQMGLEPDGIMGYLVPYGNAVQFIPSYRGLVQLARQSGEIATVTARAVYEGDEFSFSLGTDEKIHHRPRLDGEAPHEDSDKPPRLTHVYAIAKFRTGEVQFDVLDRYGVDKVRARSKAAGSGPWVTDYEEMAKKTIVRRLMKMLPISVHLRQAIAEDEAQERGEAILSDFTVTTDEAPPTAKVSKLDAVVAAKKQEAAAETIDEKPAEETKTAPAANSGPDINTLRARALMGDQDAIDELQSMNVQVGVLADINVDRLSKEVGDRYRAWLSPPPKKGA